MSLLSFNEVKFRYESAGPWLLDSVSFEVSKGEFVYISGESGCGKSTMLRVANRLLAAQGGTILLNGAPVARCPVTEFRRRVLLTPQEPAMFEGTIHENLLLPFRFHSNRQRQKPSPQEIQTLIQSFRLNHLSLADDARKLSVGQRMRLSVIRSLLLKPEVLLLDEPLAGLDENSRIALATELENRNRDDGLTVIAVSHFPWPARVTRRLTMRKGRVFEDMPCNNK